jgi:hypothetical protein
MHVGNSPTQPMLSTVDLSRVFEERPVVGRREEPREAAHRGVLGAAWRQKEQHGVAALSLRELARTLGIRPQSLAEGCQLGDTGFDLR